jgi:hypothetical protein
MKLTMRFKGGSGSGNFGHEGRPGLVGGSAPSNDTAALAAKFDNVTGTIDVIGGTAYVEVGKAKLRPYGYSITKVEDGFKISGYGSSASKLNKVVTTLDIAISSIVKDWSKSHPTIRPRTITDEEKTLDDVKPKGPYGSYKR